MSRAVIFDVDGVIVDSEQIYCEAVQETFRPYGIDITQEDFTRRWMLEQTCTQGVINDYRLGERGITLDQIRARKRELLWKYIDDRLELIPHAGELIESLYGKYPLAVVSSDVRFNVLKKLGKFGLAEKFRVMVASGETKRGKPYPDPYQRAVELLKLYPANTVVIEDNPSGVKAAKGVKPEGCKVIAYPNGFTRDMEFPEADRIVTSLAEIDEEMLTSL